MILVISIDQDDTTSDVLRWLTHFGLPYYRINEYDLIDAIDWDFNSGEITLQHGKRRINFNEITAYWYRKGNFKFDHSLEQVAKSKLSEETGVLLKYEHKAAVYALHNRLKQLKGLSNYNTVKVNKFEVLALAQQLNITIPPTRVYTEKSKLISFIESYGEVITKVMDGPIDFYGDTYWLPHYTEAIDLTKAKQLPDLFGASLFQAKIEKRYEIRSVFLRGEFYSMAIFSQLDQQTTVDFRHYNFEKPNRTVPYQLPNEEKEKLTQLMEALALDFGSIDLIVDRDGNHVFLEINPVGQFGMTSYPCNYFLEKKVAEYLSYGD